MKSSVLSLLVAAQAVVGGVVDLREVCRADNCNRAVIGTQRGSAFLSQAKADCSSFMAGATVTLPAATATVTATIVGSTTQTLATATITAPLTASVTVPAVTVTSFSVVPAVPAFQVSVLKKKLAVSPSVPTYASACSGAVRYSSVCSCYGITGGTVTFQPTSTVTATNSVIGNTITATDMVTVSPTVTTETVTPTVTVTVGVCDPAANNGFLYNYPAQVDGVGQSDVVNALNLYDGIKSAHECCARCFDSRSCTTYYFNGTSCANTVISGATAAVVSYQCPYGVAGEKGNPGSYFGLGPCVTYLGPSSG